ncbi:uncharacterized protein LOC110986544 [Acanthaster planci]|uniref:Uncharacterized protein LOC110986544 n=1 Tax=Acanthaster planci TaxID=133434 RepID=A0A8B7ZGP8_ACAPL|nr:uncharacterized protein LOC110986544 [Acanthaster planci]
MKSSLKSSKDYGSMATTDPSKSTKAWSSGSETDVNAGDAPVTFADLGVRPEAEIVQTYFGKRRPISSLSRKEWVFGALAILSIVGAAGLTIERLVDLKKDSQDFTFAMVLLLTICFCLFYVLNGIFGERPYELLIFIVGTLILMIYSIVNYAQTINTSTLKQYERDIKLARLIIVVALGPVNIVLGAIIAREYYLSRNLIFRTVGANIDLQGTLTLVILVLKAGVTHLDTLEIVVLAVGVCYAAMWFACGLYAMYGENKILVFIVLAFSLFEPAYIIYKFVDVGMDWKTPTDNRLVPAAIIMAGALGLLVRAALCCFLIYVYRNFGRGMREKAYGKIGGESKASPTAST